MTTTGDDGTLTPAERADIQRIADTYNTTIDVFGSRARGQGRNIDTDLPVGKDPPNAPGTTRSDIDFRYDGQVDIDTRGALSDELKAVGQGAGHAASAIGPIDRPPYIRFAPGQPDVHVQQ